MSLKYCSNSKLLIKSNLYPETLQYRPTAGSVVRALTDYATPPDRAAGSKPELMFRNPVFTLKANAIRRAARRA